MLRGGSGEWCQQGRAPDPGPGTRRSDDVRRQGPRHVVRADQAAVPARGSAERPRRAHRRLRFRRVQCLRWTGRHPDLRPPGERRSALHPLPHDRAVLADPGRVVVGPQPSHRRDGRHHRDRHVGTGLQLAAAQHLRAARGDAQAERLLHGPVRQVPRGSGLADQPYGTVRQLAERWWWVRALLRVHRRRDQPVRPGDLLRHHARRAGPDARGGLPLHRGHDRPRHRLGPAAEGTDAGQAVLRVLRTRRHARAAPRSAGVVGPLPRPVRPGLGRPARADAWPGRRSWVWSLRTRS